MSREDKKGWIGSIVVHLIIALALFFVRVTETRTEPEFLEVSWGKLSNVPLKPAPSAPPSVSSEPLRQDETVRKVPVDLPERTPGFDEDDPPLPATRKSVVDERFDPTGTRVEESATGKEHTLASLGAGDQVRTQSGVGESGKLTGPSLSGGEGSDVGKSVAYSMQWGDGGTRRLLAGNLPEYPEGVNVETQIRIEAVVMPGGRVRTIRPIQKGNKKLEDAAMAQVKGWVFEPLGSSAPQADQVCFITFNFVLR